MGITSYAPPATTYAIQSANTTTLPSSAYYTITGYSYTNPNITVTTSTAHGYQVGTTVSITNVSVSGTNPFPRNVTITAVTSTTFTFNYGATAPGTYTSGGFVSIYLNATSSWVTSKYMNNIYFFGGSNGHVAYSPDGKNWTHTNVPSGNYITAMDFDGTTYAFGDDAGKIFTSTTLAVGSFTDRGTIITSGVYDLKWCGGSINKWIACGGATAGATGYISYASSGAATWTSVTVTGSNLSTYSSIAFDGATTIVVCGGGVTVSGDKSIAYSTNGTSFTGITQYSSTTNSVSGPYNTNTISFIWWNAGEGRFVATDNSPSLASSATSANIGTTAWYTTGTRMGYLDSTQVHNSQVAPRSGGNPTRSIINFDNGKLYTASWLDTNFRIEIRDASNPVLMNSPVPTSYYPIIASAAINIPNSQRLYSGTFVTSSSRTGTNWCYGNNTFVILSYETQPTSYTTVYKSYLIA